jgi:phospholipase A1/A2
MKSTLLHFLHLLMFLNISTPCLLAQDNRSDSANQILLQTPIFSQYKDGYFLGGISPTHKIDSKNANIKFQFSFKQRLTDAILPFKTHLFMTFTQKAVWRILQYSSPMADNNFNPGLGVGKVWLDPKNKVHSLYFQIAHESNGRDSIFSRSWNKVELYYGYPLTKHSILTLNVWYPFLYTNDNPKILEFMGYGTLEYHYMSPQKQVVIDLSVRKGFAANLTGAIEAQLSYRLFRNANQYIGIQWFRGFGETMMVYDHPVNMIRLGLMIKPNQLSVL